VPPTRPTEPLNAPPVPRQPLAGPVVAEPMVERLPPEPPPRGPWGDTAWAPIVTGLLALIVGGLIGYAVGKGESNETRRGSAVTQTVTNTKTVVHPVVRTDTVTSKTVTQTPAPANPASEERLAEAETKLRKLERENEELKRQQESN
jgi:hypothetical protein